MFDRVRVELGRVLVGQEAIIDRLLIGLLTGGHLLLEGVPGLAKTLMARSLAAAVGAQFQRVQFTPDLLPADLVGTEIYNARTGEFNTRKGPIFTQVLLADEINRAPAKVQSALLEAMQERQVTIGHETLPLPELFLVLATQNPIEHEGTYPLPEAQIDRFLMKVLVTYPSRDQEREILGRMALTAPNITIEPALDAEAILRFRQNVDAVHVEEKIYQYVLDLVRATRAPKRGVGTQIELGASPRAGVGLVLAGKAHAFLRGRDYVTPDDIKSIGMEVLRHRIVVSFEAEAEGMTADGVLNRLLDEVPVP